MRLTRLLAAVVIAASAAACAASSGTGTASSTPRRSADLITREEIEGTDATNMEQVIQRLRPTWLRGRGQVSIANAGAGEPLVYMDDTRLGGLDALSTVVPNEVLEVRRLNAAEATNRFGTGHAGGAIVIRRRRG